MRQGSHVPFLRPQFRLPKRKLPAGEEPGESHEGEPESTGVGPSLASNRSASSSVESSAAAEASSVAGGGRSREKWFDKTGNVVVLKRQDAAALLPWPTCLVIVGKKHGPPKGSGKSPRYVVASALPRRAHVVSDDDSHGRGSHLDGDRV